MVVTGATSAELTWTPIPNTSGTYFIKMFNEKGNLAFEANCQNCNQMKVTTLEPFTVYTVELLCHGDNQVEVQYPLARLQTWPAGKLFAFNIDENTQTHLGCACGKPIA